MIWQRIARPIDGAWLAALRALFGLTMTVSMLRFLTYGWVDRFFSAEAFHFKYWGFSWVEPLSSPGMHGLFWLLAALASCMALGILFRVTASLFALGLSYVLLVDVANYLNHYYLAVLLSFLLAISPAGRIWSVDAWWARRRIRAHQSGDIGKGEDGGGLRETSAQAAVALGWLWLFRYQVGLVYFFAGLAKLNADWLIDAQPLRIWLAAKTELPILGPLFTIPGMPLLMSWFGFLFDLTVVGWLSFKRTRPAAYVVLLVFHGLTSLLFPIGMFPVIMSVLALVFFDPDWPRCVASRLFSERRARAPEESARLSRGPVETGQLQPAVVALVLIYCVVQFCLPLRFLAYGGNVAWHEQGMRFSWRVMLRAKGGSVEYRAVDRDTGEVFHVAPRKYLTPFQESELSSQPDLILQLAHHIRREYAEQGRNVAVFAEARSNLNGRRRAPLIDPQVDLGRVRDGVGKATFILPVPRVRPPHTQPVL